MCLTRCWFLENDLRQCWQTKGFSSEWTSRWFLNEEAVLKDLRHLSHSKGSWLEWRRREWNANFAASLKDFGQSEHRYSRLCICVRKGRETCWMNDNWTRSFWKFSQVFHSFWKLLVIIKLTNGWGIFCQLQLWWPQKILKKWLWEGNGIGYSELIPKSN